MNKIKVKDLATNAKYPGDDRLCMDDWDTCGRISDKQLNFDAEKGFTDHEVVIQRFSDGKYFQFTYTEFGHNGDDIREQIATEVFPHERIEIYFTDKE